MARVKKVKEISPALEAAVAKALKEVMADKQSSLTDKMRVIDRAIKLEALKLKVQEDGWGLGFFEDDEGAEDE